MRQRLQSMRSTAPSDARRLHEEVRGSAPPVEVSTRRLSALQSPEVAHHISLQYRNVGAVSGSKEVHFIPLFQFHSLGTQRFSLVLNHVGLSEARILNFTFHLLYRRIKPISFEQNVGVRLAWHRAKKLEKGVVSSHEKNIGR